MSSSGAPFPPELLKKYIAYAKRTIRPILSNAALSALEEYYVKVRSQGEEPNSPVPITARQLEALVRLSEAAAKARLSNEVGVEDAQRAIQIMQNFLKRVAMTEGGKLDVDLVQSGVSHSQRERLDIVMGVMRRLQDRPEATFSVEEYLEAADRAGVLRTGPRRSCRPCATRARSSSPVPIVSSSCASRRWTGPGGARPIYSRVALVVSEFRWSRTPGWSCGSTAYEPSSSSRRATPS